MYVDIQVKVWQRIWVDDATPEQIEESLKYSPLGNELFNEFDARLDYITESEESVVDKYGCPVWQLFNDNGEMLSDSGFDYDDVGVAMINTGAGSLNWSATTKSTIMKKRIEYSIVSRYRDGGSLDIERKVFYDDKQTDRKVIFVNAPMGNVKKITCNGAPIDNDLAQEMESIYKAMNGEKFSIEMEAEPKLGEDENI